MTATDNPTPIRSDVLVVGSGLAGLYAAICAAGQGASVVLLTRSRLDESQSASYQAQGGIAAALSAEDSPALHRRDTISAGRGACRRAAVEVLCDRAAGEVTCLRELGVVFDIDAGALSLGLEGGHSVRRVAHAGGSQTGRRITARLSQLARRSERVRTVEGASVGALWTGAGRCRGAVATTSDGQALAVEANATILATGGLAALWRRTTNPPQAVGTGLAIAHDAGAALCDLELVQFHPTSLALSGRFNGFLITEAIRGEGAVLLDQDGERFVDELEARDEVAVAIEAKLLQPDGAVYLDMRSIESERFPNVFQTLQAAGVDPSRQLVPVAPAAHYTIGGIKTDVFGRSTVPGLYAIGECSCTGVHGANRLASNSLAECLVFGRRSALLACEERAPVQANDPPRARSIHPPDSELRSALWQLAGINRSEAQLSELARCRFPIARLIATSALARRESRGVHRRVDFPTTDPALDEYHTAVGSDDSPALARWL